ncbi:DUF2267 domain-containing protein [Aquibium sp. A9E412]|uniref:DUF2267 domain-containing protein n=1 Tax=Aquibium sp. A9E412 TaxID=2976767 RepID=UPI0025B04010|nr:DUF2267 domain-containing protein [Aquibium sp. A9E412]MDN2568294.1 DUF2267 domain-containing protein [Aquibium sp. A9E412]
MSDTTISAFTQAAQHAQQWVNELSDDLGGMAPRRAYRLMRSVLHAVRDWLSVEEMSDLSAQLPMLIRGLYYENWNPSAAPTWERSKADFVDRIKQDFRDEPLDDPEAAIAAVFRLLDRHVSPGEIRQVRQAMRKGLQNLWPAG